MTKISKQQFDRAVDLIQRGLWEDADTSKEMYASIIVASCFVIKHRQGIPDDTEGIKSDGTGVSYRH